MSNDIVLGYSIGILVILLAYSKRIAYSLGVKISSGSGTGTDIYVYGVWS